MDSPKKSTDFTDLILFALSISSILIFSCGLAVYWAGVHGTTAGNGQVLCGDLTQHYAAGNLVNSGRAADLYHDSHVGNWMARFFYRTGNPHITGFNYVYPPLTARFAAVAAGLPYALYAGLWVAASILFYLMGIGFTLYSFPKKFFRNIILFLPGLPVFFYGLIVGQFAALSFLIIAGSALLLRLHRPFTAGLVTACLFYKPQYFALPGLFMLMAGHRRYFLGLGIGTLGFLCAGILLCGLQAHLDWLQVSRELLDGRQNQILHLNQSLRSFLTDCLGGPGTMRLRGTLIGTLSGLIFLSSALVVRWMGPVEPETENAQFALLFAVSLTLLISPYMMYYDLLLGAGWWVALMSLERQNIKLKLLTLLFWLMTLISINVEAWKPSPTAPLLLTWLTGSFWFVWKPSWPVMKEGLLKDWNGLIRLLRPAG